MCIVCQHFGNPSLVVSIANKLFSARISCQRSAGPHTRAHCGTIPKSSIVKTCTWHLIIKQHNLHKIFSLSCYLFIYLISIKIWSTTSVETGVSKTMENQLVLICSKYALDLESADVLFWFQNITECVSSVIHMGNPLFHSLLHVVLSPGVCHHTDYHHVTQ